MSPFSEEFCEYADYVYDQKADRIAAQEERKAAQQRKAAQEEYIITLAKERGITTEALETRIIVDLAGGVPDEQTMAILTNMLEAARRVNESDGYDEFAPDYDALAQQDESVSQIQASREAAGLA